MAKHKIARWEASAAVAVNTDWFGNDIEPSGVGKASKFTLQIMVPTSNVVEIDITDGTTQKTGQLNAGVALAVDAWYQFDVMIPHGYTFNIQHATTGTINVACMVFESPANSDI